MVNRKESLSYSVVLLFVLCLLFPVNLTAKEFSVNSTFDVPDLVPGDGLCVAYLIIIPPYVFPFCTLRAAVEETNSLAGDDEIVLSDSTYVLSISGRGEDRGRTGDLDITDSLILSGKGRNVTLIDGGGMDRIFDIHGSENRVKIRDLHLQNGNIESTIDATGDGGGAIRNRADLTLAAVALSKNSVFGFGGGGAIYNQGSCRLQSSSLFWNKARSGAAVWNGEGAKMRVERTTLRHNFSGSAGCLMNRGTLSLVNSTVSGNGTGNSAEKGIGLVNNGVLELIQTTVAENGVGLQNSGELSMVNTLVAFHNGENCQLQTPLVSQGGNLDSDGTCQLTEKSDLSNIDPLLSPLGDNGGPTWSHLFSFGSPLFDNGVDLSAEGVITDQRGKTRPYGKGYDIGAVERQLSTIVPLLAPILL